MEETVTISKREHAELVDALLMLNALDRAGVDGWQGYDFAKEIYQEMLEEG